MTTPTIKQLSEYLPVLYAYDNKGKVRMWAVTVNSDTYTCWHGLLDGKWQSKTTKVKGKNIGRANETSPETQAEQEALSEWKSKRDLEDYNTDVTQSGLQLRPMLALDYLNAGHRVDWDNWYAQPKLDGLRLVIGNSIKRDKYLPADMKLASRKGIQYKLQHLIEDADKLLQYANALCDNKCLALDGEAYKPGLPLQVINSYAKAYKAGLTESLEYHVFDLIIQDMPFEERYKILVKAFEKLKTDSKLTLVPAGVCSSEQQMKQQHGTWVEQGYEGIMLRKGSGNYSINQRSVNLFKYKTFFDDEFCIKEVWEDSNGNAMFKLTIPAGKELNHAGGVFQTKQATEFDCTPRCTHEERKQMLTEDLVGKWITVKYQDITKDGIPTFGVGLTIRNCDEQGNPLE